MSNKNSTKPSDAGKPTKPGKPYPEFPLTAHPAGYWCKSLSGKLSRFFHGFAWVAKLGSLGGGVRSQAFQHELDQRHWNHRLRGRYFPTQALVRSITQRYGS